MAFYEKMQSKLPIFNPKGRRAKINLAQKTNVLRVIGLVRNHATAFILRWCFQTKWLSRNSIIKTFIPFIRLIFQIFF